LYDFSILRQYRRYLIFAVWLFVKSTMCKVEVWSRHIVTAVCSKDVQLAERLQFL